MLVSLCFTVRICSRSSSYDVVLLENVCKLEGENVNFITILLLRKILHNLSHLDTSVVFSCSHMNSLYRLFTGLAASIPKVYYIGNYLNLDSTAEKHRMSWNHKSSNDSQDSQK